MNLLITDRARQAAIRLKSIYDYTPIGQYISRSREFLNAVEHLTGEYKHKVEISEETFIAALILTMNRANPDCSIEALLFARPTKEEGRLLRDFLDGIACQKQSNEHSIMLAAFPQNKLHFNEKTTLVYGCLTLSGAFASKNTVFNQAYVNSRPSKRMEKAPSFNVESLDEFPALPSLKPPVVSGYEWMQKNDEAPVIKLAQFYAARPAVFG